MAIVSILSFELGEQTNSHNDMGGATGGTAGVATVQSGQKRTGGYAGRVNRAAGTNTGFIPMRGVGADGIIADYNIATAFYSGYFWYDAKPGSAAEEIFIAQAAGPATKMSIRITPAGKLQAFNYNAVQMGSDSDFTLVSGTKYRLDIKVGTGASAAWEIKVFDDPVSGAPVQQGTTMSGTGNLTTNNNARASLGILTNRSSEAVDFFYDDWVCDDAAYIGHHSIALLVPDANGSLMEFTGGSYTNVNEIPASDSSYVVSNGTNPNTALFALESCASKGVSGVILAVVSHIISWEQTAVSSVNTVMLKSGTVSDETSQYSALTTTATSRRKIYPTNPDGGGAWTIAAIDALEVGTKEYSTVTKYRLGWTGVFVVYQPPFAVGRDVAVRWNEIAEVGCDAPLRWNVLETGSTTVVGRDTAFAWNVFELAGRDAALRWNVGSVAGRDVPMQWQVAGAVGRDVSTVWNVLERIGRDAPVRWNSAVEVGRDVELRWNEIAAIGRDAPLRWGVGGTVGRDAALRWNVAAQGGPQLINFNSNSTNGAQQIQITLSTTAGNTLVLPVMAGGSSTVVSVSDGVNTWNRTTARSFIAGIYGIEEWIAENIAGGNITVTISTAPYSVGIAGVLMQWSGLLTSPTDKSHPAGSTTATQYPDSGNTATTSQADELLIGFGAIGVTANITEPGGWSNVAKVVPGDTFNVAYKVVSSTGAYNYAPTLDVARAWHLYIVTHKASASGLTAVGRDAPVRWNEIGEVGRDAPLRWNVSELGLTAVGRDAELRWNLVGVIGRDLPARWQVGETLGIELPVRWQIVAEVGQDAPLRWGLASIVGRDAALRWSLNETAGRDAGLRWALREAVGRDAAFRWALTGAVGRDVLMRWNVIETGISQVGRDMPVRWSEIGQVGRDLPMRWHQIMQAGRDAALRWNAVALVGRDATLRWNLVQFVGRDAAMRWNLMAIVGRDAPLRWHDLLAVARDVGMRWNLSGAVGRDALLRWNQIAQIGRDVPMRWQVIELGILQVGRDLPLRWNLPEQLNVVRLRAGITKLVDMDAAVVPSVTLEGEFR